MKAADFLYHRARDLDHVLALLGEYEGNARILSGGQSLMAMMNMRIMRPQALIDINRVAGLDAVEIDAGGNTTLGARLRYCQVEDDPTLRERLPLLAEAICHVGDRQVRNRGTIGGSLVQADPSGNVPVAALALGATLTLRSKGATRQVPIERFFEAAFTTALGDDEMLTSISFPPHPAHHAFTEVARRHNDFAVLSVAATGNRGEDGRWRGLRMSIGAMHDTPVLADDAMRLAEGTGLEDAVIDAVAVESLNGVMPQTDNRASERYRRHLLPIHVARTLKRLRARAAGGEWDNEAGRRVPGRSRD